MVHARFPSGYVADVLQTLEVLAELDQGRDPRLTSALTRVESGQNSQGQPSTWVTLRACTVLRAAYG